MAQVIENFARDGVVVDRMTAHLGRVGEVVAEDETLVYVVGEETVVWLAAGDRHVFDPPVEALVARAVP
jgi:hypothetical protein